MKRRALTAVTHKLYALTREADGKPEIAYLLAESPAEVWAAIIETEWFGTGYTKEELMARGWRAKPVMVTA